MGVTLLPMAEISKLDDNGVLRLRNSSGASSEILLSGDNFLHTQVRNIDFEILETYYHPLPPHVESSPGDEAMISVYVRASSFPSTKQATAFSLLMQERFHQNRIIVGFRTDAYFLTDGAFPILYRFDPQGTPPSHAEYEQSKTMYCFCDQPEIQCR